MDESKPLPPLLFSASLAAFLRILFAAASARNSRAVRKGQEIHVMAINRPNSVYHLGEMHIQSCGQSVSALHGKVGVRLNAHTDLRAKRQRTAREAIFRNWPIQGTRVQGATDEVASTGTVFGI